MKIWFFIVLLVVVNFSIGCENKTSNENKKKALNQTGTKWITLSKNTCEDNGGRFIYGCEANWEDAKKICKNVNGKLANIHELRKVAIDCGVDLVTQVYIKENHSEWDKNKKNISYQSCYKKQGFISENYYWSSTVHLEAPSSAWNINFHIGNQYFRYNKLNYSYVRCISILN